MSLPAISVVIPAYNRADTIRAAVGSVLRQTVGDLEVIVVDDMSADDTAAKVEAIGDPRVRVIRHEVNQGGAAARNTGIAAARAPWIAFQDSDDEWLPLKLERQFAALERMGPQAVGVYCGMIILGSPVEGTAEPSALRYWPAPEIPCALEGDISGALLEAGSLISTQTFMARREALEQAGGFDPALKALQDWDLVIRVSRLGPIAFDPEPLVIQRFSANSLTRSSINRVRALERVLDKNAEAWAQRPAALARRCATMSGGLRRCGLPREALGWALREIRLQPSGPGGWVRLGLAAALTLK